MLIIVAPKTGLIIRMDDDDIKTAAKVNQEKVKFIMSSSSVKIFSDYLIDDDG